MWEPFMSTTKLNQIAFYTPDLDKVQDFYTVIGVKWVGDTKEKIGKTGLPESVERSEKFREGGIKTAFPDLIGDLGNIEVVFFLDKSLNSTIGTSNTVLRIEIGRA